MTEIPHGLNGSSHSLFASAARIRIAQLALGQPTDSGASPYIEAVVTLILQPYSKLDRSLSLLLAEPDVRLRSAKGQVKVTFRGAGAQQIANSRLDIGDFLLLRVGHADWRDTGEEVQAPGRKVQWDLHFKDRVVLEVRRNDSHLTTIDYEGTDTPPALLEAALGQKAKLHQLNGFHDSTSFAFTTPATRRAKRISSGSFFDASLDPFADDDHYILGKHRKRTKFGRTSGSWRLLDEEDVSDREKDLVAISRADERQTPDANFLHSPAKPHGFPDVIMLDDGPTSSPETESVEASRPLQLPPFGQPPERSREASPQALPLVSPRLHPSASPGLPLASPLGDIAEASAGYFDVLSPALSELEAIGVSSTTPQEVMITNSIAAEESINVALSDHNNRSLRSPERMLPKTHQKSISAAGEPLPTISSKHSLEDQPSTFANLAAPSQFGFAPSGFSGSSHLTSQPESTFSTTAFGASTTLSPFAVASTSSSIPAKFPFLGNSFTFGKLRGNGTEGATSCGKQATDVSKGNSAASPSQKVAQELLGDDLQRQPNQEMEPAMVEQHTQASIAQPDLEALSRERELSEDDDDMYGSARPVVRSPSMRSVVSQRSESIHDNGKEPPDVTMFDVDVGKFPPLALPFTQDWNDKTQTDRRRREQSPFLDGASDEMSGNESFDMQPEQVSTPMSSETLDPVQSSEERESGSVDLDQLTSMEEDTRFQSVTRAQIVIGPILELQGRPVPQAHNGKRTGVQTTNDHDHREDLASAEFEKPEADNSTEHGVMDDLRTDDAISGPDGDDANNKFDQLLTPDNTQQYLPLSHVVESLQQIPPLQMPPTPDNTQESAYANILRLDGPSETRSFEQEEDGEEVSILVPAQPQTATSRPSRNSLHVPALSSPYFIARRSPSLSPERQVKDATGGEIEEGVHQEEAMEKTVEGAEVLEADQSESLAPRHDKRLHNVLGMATPLSYYTPLSNLDEYYNQQIDVLAICTADSGLPTRSKAGPKDYSVTLHLADSFLDGAATVTAQVFRPYKSALPVVQRSDVMLLRSFKVQTQKRKMMLLSTDSSAWAVFSLSDASAKDAEYWDLQVDVAGPPVEYGSEEYVYAKRIMEWWETNGRLVHKVMTAKTGDPSTHPRTRDGSNRIDTTGGKAEHISKEPTNGLDHAAYKAVQSIASPRTTRSSRRTNNHTDNMENHDQAREKSTPPSPTFEPSSPTPARTTRSSRRTANRTDNASNAEDLEPANTMELLPEITSPKTGRRTPRSTSISGPPGVARSLRSQSVVHELRDGTKYVDGHIPTKKDGVHQLRDGTTYVDENVSPAGKKLSVKDESIVHELRDGTNYVDRGKSPEVRRSARHKRGGSLMHELRDGAKYTDP